MIDDAYLIGERYCNYCSHYDHKHSWCEKWKRHMPANFRMTPEHNCPHYDDPFDQADRM